MIEKRYPSVMMATACIPWDENFDFCPELFEKQIFHMLENGIKHIYLFGTAGEGYAVNNQQFKNIVSHFAMLMSGPDLHPMIGLIDMSVSRMTEKLEFARTLGIIEFQFSLPCWGALNNDELSEYFNALLQPYPDCLFLNYNLARTKRFLEPEELFQLARIHKNFVGVKHTRGLEKDFTAIASSGTPLQFFVTEFNFLKLSALTECGLLMSIGNLDYAGTADFFKKCQNGQHENTSSHISRITEIHKILKESVSFLAIDGAYDKLFTRYNLPEFHHRLLPPYQYIDDDKYFEFKKSVDKILAGKY